MWFSIYGAYKNHKDDSSCGLSAGAVARHWEQMLGTQTRCVCGMVSAAHGQVEKFAQNVLKFSCAVPFPRDNSTLDPMECMDTAEEQRVHSPPASLVPRIHVILAQKLQHINPLLPACLNEEESKTCEYLNLTSFNVDVNVHLASTYEQLLLASDSCTSEQRFMFKSF